MPSRKEILVAFEFHVEVLEIRGRSHLYSPGVEVSDRANCLDKYFWHPHSVPSLFHSGTAKPGDHTTVRSFVKLY